MTGLAAAGGVAAALYHREKAGDGQLVATSLLRLGAYMHGWDHNVTARLETETEPCTRSPPPNPLINGYRCGDGKWVWLLGMEADRHWPGVVRALGRVEWEHDPRFDSIEARREHNTELVALMDKVMAEQSRDEWAKVFDANGVWLARVQTTLDLRSDPQARAAGCYVPAPLSDGETGEMVACPVDFGTTEWFIREPAPELGQHTETILMELGKPWEDIEALKEAGAIP